MEPLDLTKRPPRSPREKVNGLFMMARTIDKMRAMLPGGSLGEYKLAGFSQQLLEALSIDEQALQEVVAKANSDDDVAQWLAQHTDPTRYEAINREFSQESTADVSERFHERYPVARKYNLPTLFDVLEYDDREVFGIAHPKTPA
jgi:Domain of unknown function (DUF5069)